MKKYCCKAFSYFVTYKCDQHENPYECYEHLLVYDKRRKQYGLIVHDLGVPTFSYVVINHCPWCGVKLYKKQRQVHRLLDFGALDKFGEEEGNGEGNDVARKEASERATI